MQKKELEKRESEFDSLIKCFSFKDIEEDDLEKLIKKSKDKWLKKNKAFKLKMKLKDEDSDKSDKDSDNSSKSEKSDDDSDNSSKSSKSGSDSEEEDEEEDEVPKFDKKKSNVNFKFSKKNRVFLTTTSSSWSANVIISKFISQYSVEILSTGNDIMIGFAPKTVNVNQQNYTNCGWYFFYNNCNFIFTRW